MCYVINSTEPVPLVETFNDYAPGQRPDIFFLDQGHQVSSLFTNQDAGQIDNTSGTGGPWETATTDPTRTGPLALDAQGPDDNTNIVDGGTALGNVIGGLFPPTPGTRPPTGVLSFLLSYDVRIIGISIFGTDSDLGGDLTLELFDRSGLSLIVETITLTGDGPLSIEADQSFAGITFATTDRFGVVYDDLRLAVPAPATLLLVLLGSAAIRWRTRPIGLPNQP